VHCPRRRRITSFWRALLGVNFSWLTTSRMLRMSRTLRTHPMRQKLIRCLRCSIDVGAAVSRTLLFYLQETIKKAAYRCSDVLSVDINPPGAIECVLHFLSEPKEEERGGSRPLSGTRF
jgi:hypothetical protein